MDTRPLTKSQIFSVLWMVLIGFYLFTGPRNFTVSTEISFLLVGATIFSLIDARPTLSNVWIVPTHADQQPHERRPWSTPALVTRAFIRRNFYPLWKSVPRPGSVLQPFANAIFISDVPW